MIKIHSLKLQTATRTELVPFDYPLSLPAAAAEMVRLNNQLDDPSHLYYMDNECRMVSEPEEFERLWYPNTKPKA